MFASFAGKQSSGKSELTTWALSSVQAQDLKKTNDTLKQDLRNRGILNVHIGHTNAFSTYMFNNYRLTSRQL